LVLGPSHGTVLLNLDGSFSYMPHQDYNGPDSFLYRASDGILQSNQTTVSITVKAVDEPGPAPGANTPPTIAVADGGSCLSGQRAAMRLTVADADTPLAGLSLSASSSDAQVVPSGSVVFGGSGAERTVSIAAAAQGSATVTVTVSDGQGGSAAATVQVIAGGSQGETLTGTAGPDMILGLGGNDIIAAAEGDDLVCGGDGNDSVAGGTGDDTLVGGAGKDSLRGGDGNDRLRGAAGNDRLQGGNGEDILTGGKGADRFGGGPGADQATDLRPGQGDTGGA
jgi:Ca2+-binding RTX toxin-like protein